MIELGEEQKTAFDSIKTFIKEQNNSAYLLTGAAGVGKSYLIKYIVDWLEQEGIQYQLCAPTHKAAFFVSKT